MRWGLVALGFLLVLLVSLPLFVNAQGTYHKFIRTFAIRGGGNSLESGDEIVLAKFDLVDFNRFHYDDINGDTWKTIKAINPDTEIYLYQLGRTVGNDSDGKPIIYLNNLGRWNISRGHSMGTLNIDNPEMFLLDSAGNRINVPAYPHEWLMDVGSTKYQNYWLEGTIHDIVDQPWTADGVFVDNVQPRRTGLSSIPVKYATDEEWDSAMHSFINAITVGLHNKNQKIWGNRGYMRTELDFNSYVNLDNLPDPPDAMLVEGVFAVKWGYGDVQFYPKDDWKRQVDLLSKIHNYKLCYQSHSDLGEDEEGTDNYGRPVNFWDVLWYAMSSYHLGKNEVDNNSYFGFSESYNRPVWYDEFDYIDLGKALGSYEVTNYKGNDIYWREFERGYVYVNPTPNDVSSISLPETCKQLTHYNFKNDPNTIPDVNEISLKAHRGTIVLKTNQPKTYYVDATKGDDSNDGLSPETAWKTIGKVNSMSFNPGDSILFKRGEIWREKLVVPSSGSPGKPIIFGAYGNGNKPRILGSVARNSPSGWTHEGGNLWFASSSVEVKNLIFDNESSEAAMVQDKKDLNIQGEAWWDSNNNRIYLYSTSNPATYYHGGIECALKQTTINIDDKAYIVIDSLDLRYGGSYAIKAKHISTGSNLTVRNCNFKFIGSNLSGTPGGDFSGRAIFIEDYNNTLIENNSFDHTWSCVAMFSKSGGYVVIIRNNTMGPHFHGYGGNTDGINFNDDRGDYKGSIIEGNDISGFFDDGIDLYHASNVIVRNNIVHDNALGDRTGEGHGIKAGGSDDEGHSVGNQILGNHIYNITQGHGWAVTTNNAENVTFAYNIIHNVRRGIQSGAKGIYGQNNGWKIYNNIFYDCSNIAVRVAPELRWVIQNNIFDGESYDLYCSSDSSITGGYNCLMNDVSVGGSGNYTGGEDDFYQTDPLFMNALDHDFHLQPDSPCVDAGVDVGLTQDFEGNPVPQGNAPDIGAYEFVRKTADLNGDGVVDIQDLIMVAGDFGKKHNFNPKADTDNNNEIDIYDVVFVASRLT